MTATERLCELLDERGVEYVLDEEYGKKYPPEKRVTWSCDLAGEDMTVTARDYCISINDDGSADYFLDLGFHEVFTPEQAIAATLGKEPDDTAMLKLHDRMNVALLECERKLGIEKADGTIVVPFVFEMHNLLEEATALGSCNCTNDCTNSERTGTCLPHFWTHDGVLHIELPKLPESISVRLPDQRDREVRSARVWQYTLDSGTCHDEGDPGDFCCSECGVRMFTDTSDTYTMIASDGRTIIKHPNYCPNCGRRIEVDE